jgi:hypothetical protein
MENTFEPTEAHTIMLDGMSNELKDAAKRVVDTLGYYVAIQFFVAEFKMTEDNAKVLADLGCYVIE